MSIVERYDTSQFEFVDKMLRIRAEVLGGGDGSLFLHKAGSETATGEKTFAAGLAISSGQVFRSIADLTLNAPTGNEVVAQINGVDKVSISAATTRVENLLRISGDLQVDTTKKIDGQTDLVLNAPTGSVISLQVNDIDQVTIADTEIQVGPIAVLFSGAQVQTGQTIAGQTALALKSGATSDAVTISAGSELVATFLYAAGPNRHTLKIGDVFAFSPLATSTIHAKITGAITADGGASGVAYSVLGWNADTITLGDETASGLLNLVAGDDILFFRLGELLLELTGGANISYAPLFVTVDDANEALVTDAAFLTHTTSDPPANGLGVGLVFRAEDSVGTSEMLAALRASFTDVNSGSEDGALDVFTRRAGVDTFHSRFTAEGGLTIGSTVAFVSPGVGIPNLNFYYGLNSAGTTWLPLARISGSNAAEFSSTLTPCVLYSSGTGVQMRINSASLAHFSFLLNSEATFGVSGGSPTDGLLGSGFANGNNNPGTTLRARGGLGTGTGAESRVLIEASDAVASGTTPHTVRTVASFANAAITLSTENAARFTINTAGHLLFLANYYEMDEITAPAAPAANKVRVFAEDNGAGKTRLMAQFPTGAAQQIAIEP